MRPLTFSLVLHALAAVVLLTVKWDVAVASLSSLPEHVTLLAPRPLEPAKLEVLPKAPLPVPAPRAFRPSQPVAPAAAPRPRVFEEPPLLEVVAPPVLLASPDPLLSNLPPRPPPPIKLGNLASAAPAVEQENRRMIVNGGFGDARVVKPEATQVAAVAVAVPMTPVEILSKPRPEYTDEARKLRLEGEVVLEIRFAANGQAQVLRLVRGLGHGLDEAAERAALLIRFHPALRAGVPVDSSAVVRIIFQLAY